MELWIEDQKSSWINSLERASEGEEATKVMKKTDLKTKLPACLPAMTRKYYVDDPFS